MAHENNLKDNNLPRDFVRVIGINRVGIIIFKTPCMLCVCYLYAMCMLCVRYVCASNDDLINSKIYTPSNVKFFVILVFPYLA